MEIFGLTPVKDNLVEKLSGGQKKRLSISMEFISNPSLFILDEPDSGLDGVMARELFEQLRRIADTGKRSHHTDLDALDSSIIDRCAVCAVLLQRKSNAKDRSADIRLCVEELKVALQSGRLLFFCCVESFDRGDHSVAVTAVLHTLIVPGTLQESGTEADRYSVLFCQSDFLFIFSHCALPPSQ
jgi:hypothetical protein